MSSFHRLAAALVSIAAMASSLGCGDRLATERARAAGMHAHNAEQAMAQGDLARALAAAELASAYDPLDPRMRDLVLRVKMTAVTLAPEAFQVSAVPELDYQAETLLLRDPAHAHVYQVARGYFTFARGDAAGAEALFRDAIQKKGDWAPAHVALGQLLAKRQKREEAVAAFEDALRFDGKSAAALSGLGRLLVEKGQLDRAVELLKKSAELKDSAALRLDLASAYLARQKVAEAGSELQRAVSLEPKNGEVRRRYGEWLLTTGQLELAQREFATASQLGAEPLATFGAAMVLFQKKDFAQAAKLFEAVAGASPQLTTAHYQAGVAYEQAAQPDAAVRMLNRYVEMARAIPAERVRVEDATARLQRLQQPPAGSANPKPK